MYRTYEPTEEENVKIIRQRWDGDTSFYDVFDTQEECDVEEERLARIDTEYKKDRKAYMVSLQIKDTVDRVYNNAVSKVFGKASDDDFDGLCYGEMLDESHSVIILENTGTDNGVQYRNYVISIRAGAVNTVDGVFETSEMFCGETADASWQELYGGIGEKIRQYFQNINVWLTEVVNG